MRRKQNYRFRPGRVSPEIAVGLLRDRTPNAEPSSQCFST
jgi:hypothetical protein